jgi:CheY-like chemotaxis protein
MTNPDNLPVLDKDEFLVGLTHDLRTPLNVALLIASDGAANVALSAEVRADFDAIRKNIDLEAELIDDLIAYSRAARGQLPLEMRAISLHSVLRGASDQMRDEIEAKHLQLRLAFDAGDPTVSGDDERLRQVFWNVLKNAVQSTPQGGCITIQTQVDPERGIAGVKIVDTGIGMTARERAHLFEPFSLGQRDLHLSSALSLGLAVSRALVEMHAGRIEVTSGGRDQGSEFTIELPLHRAAARRSGPGPAWPLPPAAPLASPRPMRNRRVRVLLVEDHAPTRDTLAKLLARRHYDVLTAGSVAEARALGAGGDFEVVIADIGLPDGDGYELMAELRAQRPGLSGIALSGYGAEEDGVRSRGAGFARHLTKPVSIDMLEEAISHIVGSAGPDAVA